MGLVAWINTDDATNDAELSRSPSLLQFFVAFVNSAVLMCLAYIAAAVAFTVVLGPNPDNGEITGTDLVFSVAFGAFSLLLFIASYGAAYYIAGSRKGLWIPIVLTGISVIPIAAIGFWVVTELSH